MPTPFYSFERKLIECEIPSRANEVLIITSFSQENTIEIGDPYNLLASIDKKDNHKVADIFDLGLASLNESWIVSYFAMSLARFDEANHLTSIDTQIKNALTADTFAADLTTQVNTLNLETRN